MSQTLKHFILFVDDDPMVLKGFRRSMYQYNEFWETEFATSGQEALIKLSQQAFDAIVTDMHMPGMDGIQLLEEVSRIAPEVLRFVLSGNTNDAQILKSTHLVHQMIPKPSKVEKIFNLVERACCLREMLSSPQLLRIINSIKALPSLPRIYNQLLEQLQSENVSTQDIGKTIAQDAAMTAKILQLVNSAFFGIAENVSSPQKAVTILGINSIKSLVLGIQVFSEYQGQKDLPVSVDAIWRHSLYVSQLAFTIARSLNLSSQEREDARVSGVLQDVGILLGFQIPGYFQNVRFDKAGQTEIESEYQFLGTSHAEMGGYLLGIWGLPSSIVEAVTFHHRPDKVDVLQPGIPTVLHIANSLVNIYQDEKVENPATYLDMPFLQKIGLVDRLAEWESLTRSLLNVAE